MLTHVMCKAARVVERLPQIDVQCALSTEGPFAPDSDIEVQIDLTRKNKVCVCVISCVYIMSLTVNDYCVRLYVCLLFVCRIGHTVCVCAAVPQAQDRVVVCDCGSRAGTRAAGTETYQVRLTQPPFVPSRPPLCVT